MTICLFICTIAFYGFTSLISKTYFSNLVLLGFDPIKKKYLHIVHSGFDLIKIIQTVNSIKNLS